MQITKRHGVWQHAKQLCLALPLIFGLLLPTSLLAAKAPTLYKESVLVAERTSAARQAAFTKALGRVLTRAAGTDLSNLSDSQRASLLENPDRDVVRYAYDRDVATNTVQLTIHFSAEAVAARLKSAKINVWERDENALTLVWLVRDKKGERDVYDEAKLREDQPLLQAVQTAERRYEVPVLWPLWDLMDDDALPVADLWGQFSHRIIQASQRYGTKNVLSGKIFTDYDGTVMSDWLLFVDGKVERWRQVGDSIDAVIDASWAQLSRALSRHAGELAQVNTETLTIRVKDVNDLDEYTKVMTYLRGLHPVVDLNVLQMSLKQMVLSVSVAGGEEAFLHAIDRGDTVLTKVWAAEEGGLAFRLYHAEG